MIPARDLEEFRHFSDEDREVVPALDRLDRRE